MNNFEAIMLICGHNFIGTNDKLSSLYGLSQKIRFKENFGNYFFGGRASDACLYHHEIYPT